MFDNFVIEKNTEEKNISAVLPEPEIIPEPEESIEPEIVGEEVITPVEETVTEEPQPEPEPETVLEPEQKNEPEPEPETQIIETGYSESELAEAVKKAEAEAYEKGYNAAVDENARQQNILLEDIKNQLMMIFAGLDDKKSEVESSSLKFAVQAVRKILPTLEKERAEAEVKNFLADNFANFAMQESLSFAFNPDMVPSVASGLSRLAEQNDFEGKIAVHKDKSLGLSDCRVEWKNGGVERNASKMLNKIEALIEDNTEERENGQ